MDAEYARDRRARPELSFRLRTRAEVVVQAIRRYGRSHEPRVLDVGAAEGASLVEIARGVGSGQYVGIEMGPGLIRSAGRLPDNVTLMQGDACSLPAEFDGSFDAVSMLAVLEHLPEPVVALGEAHRVLRPGGLVVATCPDPFWDAIAGRLGLVKDEHHLQQVSLGRLRTWIEDAGFTVLHARRFMWAPIATLPYLGIRVSPRTALAIDSAITNVPILRRLCVNAYVVARKLAG
jgi:SAM-dependent methyltransferase